MPSMNMGRNDFVMPMMPMITLMTPMAPMTFPPFVPFTPMPSMNPMMMAPSLINKDFFSTQGYVSNDFN